MQNQQPTVRLAVANTAIITGGVAGENYRVHRREFVVAAAAATILSKSVFRRRWHGERVFCGMRMDRRTKERNNQCYLLLRKKKKKILMWQCQLRVFSKY